MSLFCCPTLYSIFKNVKSTWPTDHKPIVGTFKSDLQRLSDKQQRQLSFISEYTPDIIRVAGKDNEVADSFSREASINASTARPPCHLSAIAKMQAKEVGHYDKFKAFAIGIKDLPLFCETTQPNPRPVVPIELRRGIFDSLHSLCHLGINGYNSNDFE